MTLANKITVGRIIAIPILVIALWEHALLAAQVLFTVSVFTDVLDGALARWRSERTPLGTFLDPMADKLLLVSSFITLTALGEIPVWVFVSVISRDMIIIMGWTLVYILTGNAKIQPRLLGKVTTFIQMCVVVAKLFSFPSLWYHALLYAMIACTILSACDYVWVGNKRLGALE